MRKLILSMALLFIIGAAFSQSPPKDGVLVGDETYYVESGKTSFRIVSINDTICKYIVQQFANNGKYSKITFRDVKDWHGMYREMSFYFKAEMYDEVIRFINALNKKR